MQALHQLREALNKIEKSLHDRDFEKASSLGYKEVAIEFIFLQRTLGGLQDSIHEKQKLIQDIAFKTNNAYEEVAPHVEQHMDSLKPYRKSEMIDITMSAGSRGTGSVLQYGYSAFRMLPFAGPGYHPNASDFICPPGQRRRIGYC